MNATHYDHRRLKQLREKKFTQKELAEELGVVELTIARAENGKSTSYELLLDMCQKIGIDVREILITASV
jgi:transcriptional regulator with XRE-family HTH domain